MKFIKNKKELSTSKERRILLSILEKALTKNLTKKILERLVHYDMDKKQLQIRSDKITLGNKNVFIIGAGKSAGEMALFLEKLLGKKIKGGFVNVLEPIKLKYMDCNKVSHPFPSKTTFKVTRKGLADISKNITDDDIILFLLSGGASSMLSLPPEDISETDFIEAQKTLVSSGLSIEQINSIRKHISAIKGGFLSQRFKNNTMITLALSDIASVDISALGSGPTDFDRTTFSDAEQIIKKNNLKLPLSVKGYIRKGIQGNVRETIKTMPLNSKIYLLGDTRTFATSVIETINDTKISIQEIEQLKDTDAEVVSTQIAQLLLKETERPKMFVMGGELTTSPSSNPGKGGRNQHFILSILPKLSDLKEPWAVLSFNTDGSDYIRGIGGAIIDHNNAIKLTSSKVNIQKYLESFNSYQYLRRVNSIIKSDLTNINFCDIIIVLLGVYRTKKISKD